jgi:hypothetical protein
MIHYYGYPIAFFTLEEATIICQNESFMITEGGYGVEAKSGEIDRILERVSKEYANAHELRALLKTHAGMRMVPGHLYLRMRRQRLLPMWKRFQDEMRFP